MELVYNDERSSALHAERDRSHARIVRCWSTVFSKTRSKSMSIALPTARSRSSARSWNTSNRPAFTAATAPASSRPFRSRKEVLDEIATATKAMARELNVRGLMNVQFAVKGDDVYVLEVNPRASRTVPFVSKAIGVPLAKLAAKVMTGKTLARARLHEGNRAETFLGEGSGLPVSALSGRRHLARPGNEIDRRSDGHRCRSRPRLCQIADGRAAAVAERRQRFHQRER